jgi:hypothetical protein
MVVSLEKKELREKMGDCREPAKSASGDFDAVRWMESI